MINDHDHDGDHHHDRLKPGKCFEAALEAAGENEGVEVVHAWTRRYGKWVVHAWVENEYVIDVAEARGALIVKDEYYEILGVTEERLRRYGREEFFRLMAETGSFGPFDKELFFAFESDEDPLEVMKRK